MLLAQRTAVLSGAQQTYPTTRGAAKRHVVTAMSGQKESWSQKPTIAVRAGALALAVTMGLGSVAPLVPAAYAEEVVNEENLTMYERRVLAMERRKEELAKQREEAYRKAAEQREKLLQDKIKAAEEKAAAKAAKAAAATGAAAATAAVVTAAATQAAPAPTQGGFWDSLMATPQETPKQEEQKAKPQAKPEMKAAPKLAEPQKEVKKDTKRRGPLPLWFAELLVLGSYVGIGLALTKDKEQVAELLKSAAAAAQAALGKAKEALAK